MYYISNDQLITNSFAFFLFKSFKIYIFACLFRLNIIMVFADKINQGAKTRGSDKNGKRSGQDNYRGYIW